MFKERNQVCKYAILFRISSKHRRIGLLRHAYQQNGGLR